MAQPFPTQSTSSSQPFPNSPLPPQGQAQSQHYTPSHPPLPPIPTVAFQGMPYPPYSQNRPPAGPPPQSTIPMQPVPPLQPGAVPQAYYYHPMNLPWSPNAPYPPQYYPTAPYYPQQPHVRSSNPPLGRKRLSDTHGSRSPRGNPQQRIANGRSPRASPRSFNQHPQSLQNGGAEPERALENKSDETQDASASSSTTASVGINDTPLTSHSPRSSATSTLSSPTPKSASVTVVEQWCISANKPDPLIAYGLTISPQAKPPAHIFDRAISVDLTPLKPTLQRRRLRPNPLIEAEKLAAEQLGSAEVTAESSVDPEIDQIHPEYTGDEDILQADPAPTEAKPEVSSYDTIEFIDSLEDTKPKSPSLSAQTLPKSWASLLQSESSSSQSSPNLSASNALPISSVVGFSVPASEPTGAASIPNASAILALLTSPLKPKESGVRIQPRGLINTGNMCFANTVLQVLVFTEPYRMLFEELSKLCSAPLMKPQGCPLLNATMQFMREFLAPLSSSAAAIGKPQKNAGDDEGKEPFVPHVVYEALKEKKRFESMRGGQQEDAEEFLGFYLDAIEEELSELMRTIAPNRPSKATIVREHEEDEQPERGWTEVGRHNRKVVTRTVRSVDSYISLIFGGRSRSTVRRPGSPDTANVELWRHLGLDIQSSAISTIEDALQELSRPEMVQVTSSASSSLIEASKQHLIDMLPPILVLHIKRFHYDPVLKDVVKQKKVIRFGAELVFPKECMSTALKAHHPPPKYKLYGVLYHHGLYATGGHYTLDVLHPTKTKEAWGKGWKDGWIRVDDEQIFDMQIIILSAHRLIYAEQESRLSVLVRFCLLR